jgi:hypothetical protein
VISQVSLGSATILQGEFKPVANFSMLYVSLSNDSFGSASFDSVSLDSVSFGSDSFGNDSSAFKLNEKINNKTSRQNNCLAIVPLLKLQIDFILG